MWRRWGNGQALGLIGREVNNTLTSTWVRYMSKKRAENLRKINPKVPYPEATSIAQDLFNVFKNNGPLTVPATWTSAQEAGVGGLQSKTHMKLLLKWMRGKKMLKQICQHVGSNKKFLLCTPDTPEPEQEVKVTRVKKSQTRKTSKSKKRRVA